MAIDPAAHSDDAKLVLPIIQEHATARVRMVDTGRGVRLHKTVSEHTEHIEQTLLREAVSVKRVPLDQIVALSEAPVARQEGDTWIVPIVEEILVVEKRLRIKEEVHITRATHAEPFTDAVVLRSEHVSIERFDEGPESELNSPNGGTHHATHTRSGI